MFLRQLFGREREKKRKAESANRMEDALIFSNAITKRAFMEYL